jgi:Tfp pilus assembly protein PilF
VFEFVPASVARETGEVTRPAGLYVRNRSRFTRGRRQQSAILINGGRPQLPQAEAVLLEAGDVLEFGETGVTVEVADADPATVLGPIEFATARYLRGFIGGPTPLQLLQQQQQQPPAADAPRAPSVWGRSSGRAGFVSADASGGWDESDDEDGGGGADQQAEQRSPHDLRVAAALSLARNNPAAAERQLAALLAEAPGSSAGWFVWAQLAMGSRRFAMARDLFRAAAAAAGAEVDAAEEAAEMGMAPPGAAFQMSTRQIKVLKLWARMEWDASLNGPARRLWRAAANEAFRYPRRLAVDVASTVLHAWASAEVDRDNLRNARIVIGEALRKCSTDASINVLAGSIVARAGDAEGARALFLRAYQLDRRAKREKALYTSWPNLEDEAGNQERARVLYQRGLALFPNNAKLLNVYATFESRQGNADLARSLHRHALSLDPRGASTMPNRVSWATLELEEGDADAARRLLRDGLDLHPGFAAALALMARVEREEGNLELAEAYVRRAFKVGRGWDWVFGWLGLWSGCVWV